MGDNVGRKLKPSLFLVLLLVVSPVFFIKTVKATSETFGAWQRSKQPIYKHRNLTLCVLYNNGTFKDGVNWDTIAWGQVNRVGVRTDSGITAFEPNYGSILWYPYSERANKTYEEPIWITFERFWASVGGTWYQNYITTDVLKTPFLYQRNETFDYYSETWNETYTLNNYTWGMGWKGVIDYSGYDFNVSVALETNQLTPISKLKTNVTTPINLDDHAIEYQLYLNPYWKDYAQKNVEYLRVHYLNGSHRDYNVSNVMDITLDIPDLAFSFTFLTENKSQVNTFDFSDVFSMGYESFGRIEAVTLPSGVSTYVVKIGTKLGPLASGETMVIDPSYEDFTTYTEVDPTTELTVTTNNIAFADIGRNDRCYVWDDKGASHFGNFVHLLEVNVSEAVSGAVGYVWAISELNTSVISSSTFALAVSLNPGVTGTPRFFIQQFGGGSPGFGNLVSLTLNTHYYVTVNRTGTTLNATFRTGSHSGTVQGSSQRTCNSSSLQYIYGFSSNGGSDSAKQISGNVGYLDLQEGQDLTFPLFENCVIYASLSSNRENLFLLTQTFEFMYSLSFERELGFSLFHTFNVFASSQVEKELALILSGLFIVSSYLNTSKEVYVMLTEAVLHEAVKVVASLRTTMEVAVEYATKGYVLAVGFLGVFVALIGVAILLLRRN